MSNTSVTSGKAHFASRAFDKLRGGRGLLWPGFSELWPFLLNPEPGEAGKQVQGHEARNIFLLFFCCFL